MGLFKPAWQGENEEKALKAVSKILDSAKLEEIANNAPLDVVRYFAIKRISSMSNTRLGAAERLFNNAINTQSILRVVALTDNDRMFRQYAVGKLTNLELLAFIAKNDPHASVRSEAVKKINDQSILEAVSLHDTDWEVRMNAIMKVTNQSVIGNYLVSESKREGSYKWFYQRCKPLEL
jgi:hypothetical protein